VREAGSACDEVLKLDPDNAKAGYRKAVALSSSPASDRRLARSCSI
jgi:hypothetical protein